VLKKAFGGFFNNGLPRRRKGKPFKLLDKKSAQFGGNSVCYLEACFFQHASGKNQMQYNPKVRTAEVLTSA